MLSQVLLQQNGNTEGNAEKSVPSVASKSSGVKAPPPLQLQPWPTAPPNIWDTVPINTSKHALELSPGSKSSLVSHPQKHTEESTSVFKQETLLSLVPSCESIFHKF
jgi:hypothetical protein